MVENGKIRDFEEIDELKESGDIVVFRAQIFLVFIDVQKRDILRFTSLCYTCPKWNTFEWYFAQNFQKFHRKREYQYGSKMYLKYGNSLTNLEEVCKIQCAQKFLSLTGFLSNNFIIFIFIIMILQFF